MINNKMKANFLVLKFNQFNHFLKKKKKQSIILILIFKPNNASNSFSASNNPSTNVVNSYPYYTSPFI